MRLFSDRKIVGVIAMSLLAAACSSKPKEAVTTDVAATSSGPVKGSQADLEQTAGHRVFFAYDSYALTTEAQGTLRKQAAWLAANPNVKVLVSGNCDERGTREYNLALGARRANAAKDFLVSLGVSPARLSTISYGEERPAALGSNEQAWSINRNATTTIQAGAGS